MLAVGRSIAGKIIEYLSHFLQGFFGGTEGIASAYVADLSSPSTEFHIEFY